MRITTVKPVINLKAAKELGVTFPLTLLACVIHRVAERRRGGGLATRGTRPAGGEAAHYRLL